MICCFLASLSLPLVALRSFALFCTVLLMVQALLLLLLLTWLIVAFKF